jgi:DNA-binding CsgD family transcriptional regulator
MEMSPVVRSTEARDDASRASQDRLTLAELDLLRLVSAGMPPELIARELSLSDRTVRRHLRKICDQLEVGSVIEAVVWAVRGGRI